MNGRNNTVYSAPSPWRILAVGMVGTWLLAGFAPAGAEPATEARIAQLIDELAADDFAKREVAQKQLTEIGRPAEAQLKSVLQSQDVEQRLRAQAILDEMKKDELWEPSRISLSAKEKPVGEVLAEIAKQSGNPNKPRSGDSPKATVSIELAMRPYFEALDEVCRAAKLSAMLEDDPLREGVLFRPASARFPPIAYEGPLRLQLATIHRIWSRRMQLDDGNVDRQDSLELVFELGWEQRFPLCRYAGWPRIREAKTDGGEDLAIPPRIRQSLMHVSRRHRRVTLTGHLRPPTKRAESLKSLRVELDLAAASDFVQLSLDDLSPGQNASSDGYKLQLDQISEERDRWNLAMTWSRPSPYDKMNAVDMADEYLEVQAADGSILPASLQQVHGDSMGAKFTVNVPAKKGRPTSLRYHVAKLKSRRTLSFSFENVPLPKPEP